MGTSWVFTQLADGEAKILKESIGGGFPAGGPDFEANGLGAADFGTGSAEGLVAGEAAAQLVVDGRLEETIEFALDIGVAAVASEESAKSGDEGCKHGERSFGQASRMRVMAEI
jgi:hypothetical protein